jgi:hypothetical protein
MANPAAYPASRRSVKLVLAIAVLLGTAVTILPLVWYHERLSPVLDAPGIAICNLVLDRLTGATDQLRLVDFVTYIVAGSLFWSALFATLALGTRHALRK